MAFQDATAVRPLTSNTYGVELSDDWCIGSVPNGGYVTSVLQSVVREHFKGTLAHLDQPDIMSMQLQFLRRTQSGPGVVSVEHLKLGNTTSTIQVLLVQDGRNEIQGYVVQTNFSKQTGVTLPASLIGSFTSPSPAPIDFSLVERSGEDANWYLNRNMPFKKFRRATQHLLFYHPKSRNDPSIVDQWIRFCPGGPDQRPVPFPQESLGFVMDCFPQIIEQFPQVSKTDKRWYPTVSLNLDVKRSLPPQGADWLFVRVRAAEIRNGRMDLQVVVLDQAGDVVALSSHISLILSADRNVAQRGTREPATPQSGSREGKL